MDSVRITPPLSPERKVKMHRFIGLISGMQEKYNVLS